MQTDRETLSENTPGIDLNIFIRSRKDTGHVQQLVSKALRGLDNETPDRPHNESKNNERCPYGTGEIGRRNKSRAKVEERGAPATSSPRISNPQHAHLQTVHDHKVETS